VGIVLSTPFSWREILPDRELKQVGSYKADTSRHHPLACMTQVRGDGIILLGDSLLGTDHHGRRHCLHFFPLPHGHGSFAQANARLPDDASLPLYPSLMAPLCPLPRHVTGGVLRGAPEAGAATRPFVCEKV